MFHIALHEPKIAPNTGNIIRLAANNGCHLHLIEPLGFAFAEKQLRRAGLDYHDLAEVTRHRDYSAFLQCVAGRRIYACTTKGQLSYDQVAYREGDVLLFGAETSGLPKEILDSFSPAHQLRIPMRQTSRSMNLANAVAIVTYEAWRQQGFIGGQ